MGRGALPKVPLSFSLVGEIPLMRHAGVSDFGAAGLCGTDGLPCSHRMRRALSGQRCRKRWRVCLHLRECTPIAGAAACFKRTQALYAEE
jgi:hypothetical protein